MAANQNLRPLAMMTMFLSIGKKDEMTKIFPPPAPPYDSIAHIEEMQKNQPKAYRPRSARIAAALFAAFFWGVMAAIFISWMVGGPDPSMNDVIARFIIGAAIALCFSIPFLL